MTTSSETSIKDRQILARAVVDTAFRKRLLADPEAIFQRKLTDADKDALERIKNTPSALNDIEGLSGCF